MFKEIFRKLPAMDPAQTNYVNETLTRLAYQKLVRAGDHVLDIGANAGQHTRNLSIKVDTDGRVHAFEPNVAHYASLVAIGANVRLWPCAVGDEFCLQRLHVPEGLDGWASLVDIRGDIPDRHVAIMMTPQVRIDDLLDEIDVARVTFVKLDVVHWEERAIFGMKKFLAGARPVVMLHDPSLAVRKVFNRLRYDMFELNGLRWDGRRLVLPNVAAVPNEKIATLDEWMPTKAERDATIAEALGARRS